MPFNPHSAELRFRAQDLNDGMTTIGWSLYDGDNVVAWLTLGDSDQHTTHVCLNSVGSDNMDAGHPCLEILGPDTHARLAPTDWVTVVFSASADAPAVSIYINGVVAATSTRHRRPGPVRPARPQRQAAARGARPAEKLVI